MQLYSTLARPNAAHALGVLLRGGAYGRVSSTGELTLPTRQPRPWGRCMPALPRRGSQAVHDGLLSYKPLEGCAHGLCNAHHLRELVYIHEDFREKAFDGWAAEMGALL